MPHERTDGRPPLFRRLPGQPPAVTIHLDGEPLDARAGDSVAAALLAAGVLAFRNATVGGEPRAPYCLIGNCFECLVEIDGQPNRQACLVTVTEGMQVRLQQVPAVPLAP